MHAHNQPRTPARQETFSPTCLLAYLVFRPLCCFRFLHVHLVNCATFTFFHALSFLPPSSTLRVVCFLRCVAPSFLRRSQSRLQRPPLHFVCTPSPFHSFNAHLPHTHALILPPVTLLSPVPVLPPACTRLAPFCYACTQICPQTQLPPSKKVLATCVCVCVCLDPHVHLTVYHTTYHLSIFVPSI